MGDTGAQVVATLTSHPAVHEVSIFIDGQLAETRLPDGNLVHHPLLAANCRSFLAPTPTPSPSPSS